MANIDDREGVIWVDGKYVNWRDAKVHILTHSLHYGGAVFEGTRCYDGNIFKLREHNARLIASAQLLDMNPPYTVEQLDEITKEVVAKSGYKDCYIRPIYWRGSEQMGLSAKGIKEHLAIAVWEWPAYFSEEQRLRGLRLEFSKWKRPSPETIPSAAKASGLYMICTMSKDRASKNGFDDALMLDYQGRIAECTGANIFFIKGNKIVTPPPDCFLNGITRQTAIEIARWRGFDMDIRHIMPDELDGFDECFITGTAAEITPISEIGAHRFVVGEVCKSMMKDYADLVRRKISL